MLKTVIALALALSSTSFRQVIMLKTVSADFRKYRELETQEEAQEETGWKLVHGDVFRPPQHEMLLSVFVGNGVQVCATSVQMAANLTYS